MRGGDFRYRPIADIAGFSSYAQMSISLAVERVRAIAATPAFAIPEWWLTFYLTAEPARLDRMADRLSARGAVNLGGGEGGFLYPKLQVTNDAAAVAELVADVQQLATILGVEVLSVDVDTSPDIKRTHFKELVRFDQCPLTTP